MSEVISGTRQIPSGGVSGQVRDQRRVPFFMVGKDATRAIEEAFTGRRLPIARSVYFALVELANDARTPGEVVKPRKELAAKAGVNVRVLDEYASELERIGLLAIERTVVDGLNKPNRWVLTDAPGVVHPESLPSASSAAGGGASCMHTTTQDVNAQEKESLAGSREPDEVEQVWGHYQATHPNGKRCTLTRERCLLIKQALKVRSTDECKQAITSMLNDEWYVGKGLLDLKYALRGGGRSPNPEATIDRLVAQGRNGGRSNGDGQRRYFDGLPWEQLSSAEKLAAQEMRQMDMDPADPETWKGDQTSGRPSGGKSFTAATFLSDEVGELVGATNGNGRCVTRSS